MIRALATLALAACTPAPDAPLFDDDALLAELDGYEAWGAPPGWEGLAISCDASHGPYVRLYANDIALADLTAGTDELSEGALLVNASFQDTDGTPKLTGAMRKVPGYAPAAGNWYWGQLDEAGGLVLGGAIPACSRCHAASDEHLRHRDALPPPTRTACE